MVTFTIAAAAYAVRRTLGAQRHSADLHGVYLALAEASSVNISRSLAARIGEPLVRDVIAAPAQAETAALCSIVANHLPVALYDEALVECALDPARREAAITLIYGFMTHSDGKVSCDVREHPRVAEFLEVLTGPLACHMSTAILLMLDIAMPLPPASQRVLRERLRLAPQIFRFRVTDSERTLTLIVDAAARLGVPAEIAAPYRRMLADAREERERKKRLHAAGLGDMQLPADFKCPITLELMKDPVVASDGHSYECSAFNKLMATTRRSPLTRELLRSHAFPNLNLRKRIRDYADEVCDAVTRARRAAPA